VSERVGKGGGKQSEDRGGELNFASRTRNSHSSVVRHAGSAGGNREGRVRSDRKLVTSS